MADVPVLACTAGELTGKRIPVPEGGLGIGRSPDNAVVIHDEGVSRYHGRLLFENGSLWLQDAGSRNGVFVNGVRVTGHKALKVGDSITIAQHTFELQWQEPPLREEGDGPARASERGGSKGGGSKGARPKTGDLPLESNLSSAASSSASASGSRGWSSSPPAEASSEPATRRRWFWPFS